MSGALKKMLLLMSHGAMLLVGIALGIYLLPILTAPASPTSEAVNTVAQRASFSGEAVRDLADSDALHWGEGTLHVHADTIAFDGELAPGPDYRLYLAPAFVETEADFLAQKDGMVQIGPVNTFENFMLSVPAGIDVADYRAAIVWCEAFGQFITAVPYR